MSIFRRRGTSHSVAESPSLLFRDLRRSADIKFLWEHQGKLLEEYHKRHLNTANVALELPTGSGKTLVGLLIAEYKRQISSARVVYLCPTRQLCNQVKAQATGYGINCSLLIGRQRDYDIQEFTRYQRGQAIAITTYSGLFNTNPRIDDPQVIICDDAHAADNYISSLWSLQVSRQNHPTVFSSLVEFLGDAIPSDIRRIIQSDEGKWDRALVDLVPAPRYAERIEQLSELLEVQTRETDLIHSWRMIAGHLEACNIYISPDGILIRPIIPPARTHAPFANASQRVFMSATLGEGGDLERITGLTNIARLPIPEGWDKRGTGRRLVLFPNLLSAAAAPKAFMDELIAEPERTLVLVKENRLVRQFDQYEDEVKVLHASDIEESLDAFTSSTSATVLVLANRYDGINLPGDLCRKMILLGLPASTDLQEKFLYQRLGATSQLRDRIRTRITQGVGRCTRDENDYALVVLIGNDILKWCSTETNLKGMHPELHAEITFGLDNSTDRGPEDFRELASVFLKQGEEWAGANEEIIGLRNRLTKDRDSITEALERSTTREISYVYSMWNHEFDRAFDQATAATDALSGGSELRPYRAFWHYMGSVSAYYEWKRSNVREWQEHFTDQLNRALASSIGVSWLPSLRDYSVSGDNVEQSSSSVKLEAVLRLLEEWQLVGTRFERNLNAARENINSDEADSFEDGLRVLGRMLGCNVVDWTEAGAPDGLWILSDNKALAFEAKSEESPNNAISLRAVRQAATHETWIRRKNDVSEETEVITALITHQSKIMSDAQMVAEEIRYIPVSQVRDLFARAATVLNSIRSRARALPEELLRELIDQQYREAHLTHSEVSTLLLSRELRGLPVQERLQQTEQE